MSKYVFDGKKFENLVVFSDQRFGEIRVLVDDDGTKLYVGIDIAACIGYSAPTKAVMRSGIPGRIRMVPWIFKKKSGSCDTRCFDETEAFEFINRGQELPEGFMEWFCNEVILQSRNIKVERDIKVNPVMENELEKLLKQKIANAKVPYTKDEVFERLDGIILDILTLKKEIAGKMNSTT